jgi:acetyl esterase/lipase
MLKKTFLYGSDPEFQSLDCLLPDRAAGPSPVVVCIHGGGWHAGARGSIESYGRLIVEAGFAALLPDYRLTGTASHPAQIDDMESVLDWISREGRSLGLDPTRVSLTGASAGGHLAALLGLRATRHANGPCTVRCMIPVCGVFDIARWRIEKPEHVSTCVAPFLGGRAEDRAPIEREASPIFQIHPHAPPCLCTHGMADAIVPLNQSEDFVAALRREGIPADLVSIPGCGHTADQPNTNPAEPLGGWPVFRDFLEKHGR